MIVVALSIAGLASEGPFYPDCRALTPGATVPAVPVADPVRDAESESAFTNPECLLKVWWKGASIKEFPVPFLKRQPGTAKGTRPGPIVRSVADIVRCWTRWILLGRWPHRGRGTVSYWQV
jgi:hypothetical protein